jgi:hypothetical protein
MRKTYYCRLRPPAPGCQPKNGLLEINFNEVTIQGKKYWGSVTYNRNLTKEELFEYDLDEIVKTGDLTKG